MPTIREELVAAIEAQESDSGRADTSKPNHADAIGSMQVTRPTFDSLKGRGIIPRNYEFTNPAHSREAGVRLVHHLADKYNDDPSKVAAAYYSGEKAVRKDGSIADFRDRKFPDKYPSTKQYVSSILGRMGMGPASPDSVKEVAAIPTTQEGRFALEAQGTRGQPLQRVLTEKAVPTPLYPVPLAAGNTDAFAATRAAEAQAQATEAERQAVGFGEQVGLSWLHNTMLGALAKKQLEPDYKTDPAFKLDMKDLEGLSVEEQERMLDAGSSMHAQWIRMDIDRVRGDQAKIAAHGGFQGFMAGLAGGSAEGVVSGMAVTRLFSLAKVGSAQLAARGAKGAAIGSLAAENVIGNVGMTAIQDAFDPYVGAADYAMAAALGTVVTPIGLPGIGRDLKAGADLRAIYAERDRLIANAAEESRAVHAQAVDNLGTGATPEALRTEARRIDAERIQRQINSTTAPLPQGRMLVSDENRAALYGEDPTDPAVKVEGEAPAKPTEHALPEIDFNFEAPKGPVLSKGEGVAPQDLNKNTARSDERTRDLWNKRPGDAFERTVNGKTEIIKYADEFAKQTGGLQLDAKYLDGLAAEKRSHYMDNVPTAHKQLIDWVRTNFLNDRSIVISDIRKDKTTTANGSAMPVWSKIDAIRYNVAGEDSIYTLTHELGHLVFNRGMRELRGTVRADFLALHQDWLKSFQQDPASKAALMRGSTGGDAPRMAKGIRNPEGFVASLQDVVVGVVGKIEAKISAKRIDGDKFSQYFSNADEFGAEQLTKYLEAAFHDVLGWKPKDMPTALVAWFRKQVESILGIFGYAKKNGMLAPDSRAVDFFDAVRDLNAKSAPSTRANGNALDATPDSPTAHIGMLTDDNLAQQYGFTHLPQDTPLQRAEFKATADLYRRALNPEAVWNSPDLTKNLSALLETAPLRGAQSTSATMLRSNNPVMRMIATELLESPSGAGGRRANAAISKAMRQSEYMGNALNDVQAAYKTWRNEQGGSISGDIFDGNLWTQYNRMVAQEIEARGTVNGPRHPAHEAIARGADALEAAYERMRLGQTNARTIGWKSLPSTSVGYMPHRMSPEKVRNMSNGQRRVLTDSLAEQFEGIEGFDAEFSRELANKYVDRVHRRALGDHDTASGVHQMGAPDVIQSILTEDLRLTPVEAAAVMRRYMQAAPGHTKRRLQLDLNREYDTPEGTFRLLDIFETDQVRLLQSQVNRVSGEVALARHGVMGRPGLALLRRSMGFGEDAGKAQKHELEAFDQVAAEFIGEPFGTNQGKWLDRAMQFNSVSRLGGMGFTQLAESINFIPHVGLMRAIKSVLDLPRLRSEAAALARGEVVDNPLLASLESFGGREFGTENRKMVFPFQSQEFQYQTFGQDTGTAADRLLRGAVHLQGGLSMWRAIHGAQQRGAAEQIVAKAFEMIQSGREADTALKDMGISLDLQARLRAELPRIAEFDGSGKLTNLDITRIEDVTTGEEFVQAVHRGSSQIIQGTFIGEQGKWVHDGLMKMVTQFRTFSLTSIEKQWGRQVNAGGYGRAVGILIGSMSMAAPIYIMRTYAASIGRSDQQEYLDKRLSWDQVARATMNYVALTGLAGDFMDAASAVTGVGVPTGGRTGGTDAVGNVIAPSLGTVNDVYKAVQNTKEGTDPHALIKQLPFSRLPYVIPAINALGE